MRRPLSVRLGWKKSVNIIQLLDRVRYGKQISRDMILSEEQGLVMFEKENMLILNARSSNRP